MRNVGVWVYGKKKTLHAHTPTPTHPHSSVHFLEKFPVPLHFQKFKRSLHSTSTPLRFHSTPIFISHSCQFWKTRIPLLFYPTPIHTPVPSTPLRTRKSRFHSYRQFHSTPLPLNLGFSIPLHSHSTPLPLHSDFYPNSIYSTPC